jgi:hypothetical protein
MKVLKIVFLFMVFLYYTAVYAQPSDVRVTLGAIAHGYSVRMEVNGHYIADIQGGQSEMVQLFHVNYPHEKKLPPDLQYVNSLREGRNTIKIKYDLTDASKANLSLRFYMNSVAYAVPVFEFVQKEKKSGEIEAEFEVFQKMPAGYKTITLTAKEISPTNRLSR